MFVVLGKSFSIVCYLWISFVGGVLGFFIGFVLGTRLVIV